MHNNNNNARTQTLPLPTSLSLSISYSLSLGFLSLSEEALLTFNANDVIAYLLGNLGVRHGQQID